MTSCPSLAGVLPVEGLGWIGRVWTKSLSDFFFRSLAGLTVGGGGVAAVLHPAALAGGCCWCFCCCCCWYCCCCCCGCLGAGFFFSGAVGMARGSGCCGGVAGVFAPSFSFSRSLGGSGRVKSWMRAEVPSISKSMTEVGDGPNGRREGRRRRAAAAARSRSTRVRRTRGKEREGRGLRGPWAHPECVGVLGGGGEGRRRWRFAVDGGGSAGEDEDDGLDPLLPAPIAPSRRTRTTRRR